MILTKSRYNIYAWSPWPRRLRNARAFENAELFVVIIWGDFDGLRGFIGTTSLIIRQL
jgi:hypothetical protein